MNGIALAAAIVFTFTVIYIAIHIISFRVFLPKERWVVLRQLWVAFVPVVFVVSCLAYRYGQAVEPVPLSVAGMIGALTLLWLLHNGYLMFYAFIDRSLSIRVNCELHKNNNRPIELGELAARYDIRASYLRRLEILKFVGYLESDGTTEGFRLTSKGLRLARSVKWLKDLYKLGPGG